MTKHRILTKAEVYRIAAEASADPRSVAKAATYGARSVRGIAGERIAEAASRLGLQLPDSVPPPSSAG